MIARPWHHRWNILALTLLSQAVMVGIHTFAFAFLVLPWSEEFQAPRSEIMLIISASLLIIGLSSPFVGVALDRFPIRRLFVFGTGCFVVGLLAVALAPSHWVLLLVYATLFPVSMNLCGPLACQMLIARWFSTNRGFALGFSSLGTSIGAFVFPVFTTTLLAVFDWREVFLIMAAVSILIMPAAWMILRHAPQDQMIKRHLVKEVGQSPVGQPMITTHLLLRNRDFWVIVMAFAAWIFVYMPVLHGVGAYAHDLGISQPRAAFVASMAAVTLAIGKLSFGKLSDVLDARRVYWIAVALTVVGIASLSWADTFIPFALGLLLTAFAMGAYMLLLSKIIVDTYGAASFGRVLGLVTLFTQINAVAPYLAAIMRDALGGYGPTFMVLMIAFVPAVIAMRFLSGRSHQDMANMAAAAKR